MEKYLIIKMNELNKLWINVYKVEMYIIVLSLKRLYILWVFNILLYGLGKVWRKYKYLLLWVVI